MNSLSGQGLTLGDAAHYSRLRIETAVAQIERWSPLVDPELLRMACQVADCPFVRDETISTEPSLYGGRAEMLLNRPGADAEAELWNRWADLLRGPITDLASVMIGLDEDSKQLRSTTPFVGLIDEARRTSAFEASRAV